MRQREMWAESTTSGGARAIALRVENRSAALFALASSFLSARFLRFACVGSSGVLVNLSTLALLLHVGTNANAASLLAIEVSTLTNFHMHRAWTFRDRRSQSAWLGECARFHAVTAVGALLQFTLFLALSMAAWHFLAPWHGAAEPTLTLRSLFLEPPPLGDWRYLCQLCAIVIAMAWNFLAHSHVTWKGR